MVRAFLAALFALAALCATRPALADKIVVLPFVSAGNATAADLDAAREATREAARKLGHKLPGASEMVTAEMAAKAGGTSPTSDQLRAAGRSSTADWVSYGRVAVHGATYRLELEVCQVDTGRVESLNREVEAPKAADQIAEMLTLMLRPEGVGNADIPWLAAPAPTAPPPANKPPPTEVKVHPPTAAKPPPPAPEVRHPYAEKHPLALGIPITLLGAIRRSSGASGSATSLHVGVELAYALDALPGLELRGAAQGSAAGPGSAFVDAGARYMFGLLPTKRLYVGPELRLGLFGTLGGDRTTRFLLHNAAVVALGLGERIQIEAAGDLLFAPGGQAALILGGGSLRGLFRF